MQTHIDKAYSYLDEHLPYEYASLVVKELKKNKINTTAAIVRNVRVAKTTTNLTVLNALLIVAKKHKKEKELLKHTLNN